jgi:putative CocE/NonD family hydrolase
LRIPQRFAPSSVVLLLVLVLLVALVGVGGGAPRSRAAAMETRDVFFTASDGVKLHATIGGAAPLVARPVIIEDSPYAPGVGMPFGDAYNYVQLQWRGTGRSGGTWNTTGARDQLDLSEFVGWACGQPWSNGRIGLYGFSASAIAVYNSLHLPMPCVKAAALMAGTVDLYRDLLYIGGIQAAVPGLYVYGAVFAPWMQNLPQRLAEQPESLPDSLAGYGTVTADVATHQTEDAYWLDRTFKGNRDGIPILADTSFYDVEPRGPFLAYEATKHLGSHLLVMGAHDGFPAGTAGPFPEYARWFDHYVRGVKNGIDREPPVSVYLSNGSREQLLNGSFTHFTARDWPLPTTQWTRLFLTSSKSGSAQSLFDGTLSTTRQAAGAAQPYPFFPANSLETDPHTTSAIAGATQLDRAATYFPFLTNMALTEPTSITFTTPPFASAVDAVGPASVDLFVSSTAPESDLVVVLADVWPDGTSHAVTTGQLRTSFPKVDRARSRIDPVTGEIVQPYTDFSAKTPAAPGEMREYHVELLPLGNHFGAGHRLRLYVVGTPNHSQPAPPGINTVSLGGITPSRLILPTLGAPPAFR